MLVRAMLPALTSLLALQDVESRAEDARRRIADAPSRVEALDAELEDARQALEAAKSALAASQAARREHEKEAGVAQQRVSKYKDQLMEAKDNRQFHALQHEIATFSAEVQKIEEQILVRMLEGDELTATVKAAEARLAADTKRVAAQKAAIDTERAQLARDLESLQRQRADIAAGLPPALVAMFESMFKARRGTALSKAVDGLCEACRVRIRPALYNEIRRGDQIIQCESCQRILYYVPPAKPAESDAPSPPPPPAS
jgi:predicted  nucleic acid-binding Zn-ribbon protein